MKKKSPIARPIRFELHKNDVLIYLHIPKTGGLSLTAILDAQFPAYQVCPIHSPQQVDKHENIDYSRYRLVRGHFRFGPYDKLLYRQISRNPVLITMLREPISRVISSYRFQIQQNKINAQIDFETFVNDPEFGAKFVVDRQSRLIVGAIEGINDTPSSPFKLSDAALLRLAQERLRSMPWFGLTERYNDSIKLLCYTFGWPIIKEPPVINKTQQKFDDRVLTPAVMSVLKDKLKVDIALYQYAQTLFEERYQEMIDELLVREHALQQQYKKPLDYQKYLMPTPTATVLPPPPTSADVNEAAVPALRSLKKLRMTVLPKGTRREMIWLTVKHQLKRIRRDGYQVKRS